MASHIENELLKFYIQQRNHTYHHVYNSNTWPCVQQWCPCGGCQIRWNFGIEWNKRGEDQTIYANEEAFSFNDSRNHQDLPNYELEKIPHSTFDLDVFKVEIYYHKTQTIIMSFIGGKITY